MSGIIDLAQFYPSLFTKLDTSLGLPTDTLPGSDTANSSLIALTKRELSQLTNILAKLPALQNGSIPVVSNSINSAGTCVSSTYAASSTSGTALAASSTRRRALILNPPTSSVTVGIAFLASATYTNSIPLAPSQAWLETPDGGYIHQGLISAITASGTSTLLVFEWS